MENWLEAGNGFRLMKWIRRPEFKLSTKLFALHFVLIPLRKGLIYLITPPQWINSSLGMTTGLGEGKLNSKAALILWKKLTLCRILPIAEGLGKHVLIYKTKPQIVLFWSAVGLCGWYGIWLLVVVGWSKLLDATAGEAQQLHLMDKTDPFLEPQGAVSLGSNPLWRG